jgi:hypothetical protein
VPIAATAASAPNMGAMCFRPIPIIDPSLVQAGFGALAVSQP